MQHLFYPGDNLVGLRLLSQRGTNADLVYIDPPFATNNRFLLDADRANTISASGRLAYADTTRGSDYLNALKLRLLAIRDVMSSTASIYVHIDLNMEHHVRFLMDEVFGPRNFRNSITRIKSNPKNFDRNSYGNIKDTILFYSISPSTITWNPQRTPLSEDDLKRLYPRVDADGRRYTTTPLHAPGVTRDGPTGRCWRGIRPPRGRHWRYAPEKLSELHNAGLIHWSATGNPRKINYADQSEGKMPQDIWEYKDPQRPLYPTQKNAAMLERIILTSSNPGDTVMDCYAGSGSTLVEAARLGRRFIGMDDSPESHRIIRERMKDLGLTLGAEEAFTTFEPTYPEQPSVHKRPVSHNAIQSSPFHATI
ncbi:MAG: site-specific DNA-methyltransferase [Dehalococcoidia bacterium]|nr:site-specific DNA-methyltransferase [Dehalococcoidia bacterium]